MSNRRKHRQQMTPAEMQAAERLARSWAGRLSFVDHADERGAQKGVTPEEIRGAVLFGSVIEVHANAAPDCRAVLRRGEVCVVLSLCTGQVVTTWRNRKSDQHDTLDLSQYQWPVNVVALVSGLQKVGASGK